MIQAGVPRWVHHPDRVEARFTGGAALDRARLSDRDGLVAGRQAGKKEEEPALGYTAPRRLVTIWNR